MAYELPANVENRPQDFVASEDTDKADLYYLLDEIVNLLGESGIMSISDSIDLEQGDRFISVSDEKWKDAIKVFPRVRELINGYFVADEIFPYAGYSPVDVESDLNEISDTLLELEFELPSRYIPLDTDEEYEKSMKFDDDAEIVAKIYYIYNQIEWMDDMCKDLKMYL